MLRSLLSRTTAALAGARAQARTYVTQPQVSVINRAVRAAKMEVNPRIGMPEPVVSVADRQRLRADPLLAQLVNMVMRDGKKMRAERLVHDALLDIRKCTNSDPYRLMSDAINLVSPLMDTKGMRQGGSKVVQVPRALYLRQRRRRAIVWLLESADKRNESSFSMRLSGELQAIVNGTSGVLDKKLALHKLVLANRAAIPTNKRKRA